jgi:Glycoside-hydrolase family GH114
MLDPMRARPWRVRRLVVGLAMMIACLAPLALVAAAAQAQARHTRRSARVALSPVAGQVGTSVMVRGSGFRPRRKGVVLFAGRRVTSFDAGRRGRFLATFVVPAGSNGRVRLTAEQLTRSRRGGSRRLRWASVDFRVLPGGSSGTSLPGAASRQGVSPGGGPAGSHWVPPQRLTWYWQLQGAVNNSEPVAAYDIDGFENSAGEVATLHAQGKHVICYIDVGTWEPGRPDSKQFPSSVLGSGVEGWPGEKWLDIRQLGVLEPIMTARFQICREKGFDAVEPDNMDGYENATGFPIAASQQLSYDEWVAGEAHALGMAVFQKNDSGQTEQLQPYFDGALDEQCNQYKECAAFHPYLAAGKPVLNAEYSASSFCAADNAAGIMGARFSLELNGTTFEPCW